MHSWFRLYVELLDDPKAQALPPRLFKFWINILCVAAIYDGKLPDVNVLKHRLKARLDYVKGSLNDLLSVGLIDDCDGVLRPHNWDKRQYKSDSSTERVNNYRSKMKRYRNVAGNVTVTLPDNRNRTNTTSVSNSLIYNRQQGINGVNGVKNGEDGEKEPRHNAKSRAGFIYCRKGTFEFQQYAADYRAKWQDEPQVNKWGGRWFSLLGEK